MMHSNPRKKEKVKKKHLSLCSLLQFVKKKMTKLIFAKAFSPDQFKYSSNAH